MPVPSVSRVLLYVKDIEKVAQFYERHFRLSRIESNERGWLELTSGSGCNIAIHQAAVSQKSGAAIKIVFGVKDVAAFKAECAKAGLKFGAIHRANGIEFANAKDPAGNSISISNRGMPE
ncbi:MAG: VOC family protein [Phycisphaerales bacterium]|nr:VOC family protein [Phycisphaerales bacterium]MCB9854769.1 VOC family protein [Phycisphaerales bacterium]MCB9863759.1 VOC family protein [Phycisphaerales bacterium]